MLVELLPEEAVDVFEPLGYEVVGDGLGVVWKTQILQRVEEEWGAVVKCSDGHLQAHGPQLTGLHLPCETLQSNSHKQWHHLQHQRAHFTNAAASRRGSVVSVTPRHSHAGFCKAPHLM